MHGEDFAKQAAAMIKNTVVGIPGIMIPTTPKPIENRPEKIKQYLITPIDCN